jgi:hypothetical protein
VLLMPWTLLRICGVMDTTEDLWGHGHYLVSIVSLGWRRAIVGVLFAYWPSVMLANPRYILSFNIMDTTEDL